MASLQQWCEKCQAATTSWLCPTCGDTLCASCQPTCETVWCLPDDELDRRNREAEWRAKQPKAGAP